MRQEKNSQKFGNIFLKKVPQSLSQTKAGKSIEIQGDNNIMGKKID